MATEPGVDEHVVAYRLGEVEKAVKENNLQINKKLDSFLEIRDDVTTLKLQVLGLIKSRDRLITALAGVGTASVLAIVNQLFGLVGSK